MSKNRHLRHDCRGASAVEFALVAPIFILLMTGIVQMGMAFYASAGLRNGVESAARYAQIYPRPSDSQISAMMVSSAFGLNASLLAGPTLTHGTANGVNYVDISAIYSQPINIAFIPTSSVNLNYSRRAYQY